MQYGSVHPALTAAFVSVALAACMPSHQMTHELPPGRTCPGSDGPAWYFPTEAGDNSRLEDWCLTVGPPVVELEASGSFLELRTGKPGGDLTVWSWNVAAGGGDVRRFLAEEAFLRCAGPGSTLRPEATHLVLLVQEGFRQSGDVPEAEDPGLVPRAAAEEARPGDRTDIVDIARDCGLSLAYVAASRNGHAAGGGEREDRGVAILSTLPLSDVWFIELPYEAARRVAVGATVRAASGHGLRLVNVHFTSAPPPARMLVTGNGSRLRQGLAVVDALEQVEAADSANADSISGPLSVLLAGDFNTWSNSETTLLRLRDSFPDSPDPLSQPTRGAFPTDHILFRRGYAGAPMTLNSSHARLEDRFHSDHHPVGIRIRFPAGSQSSGAPALEHLARPSSP
ncbi:MAG: endonuclease/exonuclease/phosphatase family protein [marine benthic group bacterium]|nr:endonuclease/exonuclease/phosphatase family protein [Gemmatimonadota bacterium]